MKPRRTPADDEPMSDPLVPGDVDLRDFPFMPLNVRMLRDSDLAALASGDEFKAAVLLWCYAWHQVPAGSLPNDDRVLALHSGAGARWPKVRDMALRGFVECSDGRLYHRVLCDEALKAGGRRAEYREAVSSKTERQRRWRERQRDLSQQLHDLGVTPPPGASLETLQRMVEDAAKTSTPSTQASTDASTPMSTVDAPETPKTRTRTRTGTGTGTGTELQGSIPGVAGDVPAPPPAGNTRSRKPPLVPMPEGFAVSDRVRRWAAEKGHDRLDEHLDAFVRKCQARAYAYADWDSAFMEAIREDWAGIRSGRRGAAVVPLAGRQEALEARNRAAVDAFVREGGEHAAS